jgi:hypothetical protein
LLHDDVLCGILLLVRETQTNKTKVVKQMIKFETNKNYYCTSICDHNARFDFTITKRTIKSVWIGADRFKIFLDTVGNEFIYPSGRYSMCLVLRAERVA